MTQSIKPSHRHRARCLALQACYQWQMMGADASASDILAQFLAHKRFDKIDADYFQAIFQGAVRHHETARQELTPLLEGRTIKELDPITASILYLAHYELKERLDIPYRVVINEGLELAKRFGPEDGHKFVNGVLNALAEQLRPLEKPARGK